MKCYFNSCSQAIKNTLENKTYGLYYSEKAKNNQEIHSHDCCEIFLCLSDNSGFLIDGKLYTAEDSDVFILNHLQAHKVLPNNLDDFKRYSFHVHPSFIAQNSTSETNLSRCFYGENKVDKITLSKTERDDLIAKFNRLEQTYEFGDDVYKNTLAVDILLKVNELSFSREINQCGIDDSPLQLAINFISLNFDKNLDLSTIAKNSYVSVNKLCALFKENLNTTVIKFLTSKRLTNAKKMLENDYSITDSAFASGFNDYANFIRVFKTAVGVSPGKYKKQYKEKT
ncbi:MAG: helix-turn-helix transcriptional regulator [Clostridia bacterium]|nr:helix-turn-helix transcriptional regulator [Clostridia bacterium]